MVKEQRLAAAQEKKRSISQAQITKAGFVYIISNIGSFGDDVYKIGMTRRLVPQDRIDELGDALRAVRVRCSRRHQDRGRTGAGERVA